MRIVHIITRFIRGGADENTLLTVNGQAALGHEVHLVHGEYHPAMIAALDPRVIAVHEPSLVRPVRPASDLRCMRRLTRYLKRTVPDIVHTHESKAGVIGRAAARAAGTKRVVHTVHILPFLGVSRPAAAVYLALEKLAARVTDAFIDVSPGMRDVCIAHGLGTADNHFVIESGMDVARFRDARPLPELAGDGDREVTGLIAGTLEPRKRIAPFLAELARTRPTGGWRLLIAGDGVERDAIAALIEELALGDRVTMLGHRKDLERLIASADLCVHAARNEGLPRVVVQYVLGGRPVVAATLAGIERVVEHGRNGLLAPGDDLSALAGAFLRLVDDAAERARMAAASRSMDLSAWDHRAMVDAIERVYRRVGAGEPAAA